MSTSRPLVSLWPGCRLALSCILAAVGCSDDPAPDSDAADTAPADVAHDRSGESDGDTAGDFEEADQPDPTAGTPCFGRLQDPGLDMSCTQLDDECYILDVPECRTCSCGMCFQQHCLGSSEEICDDCADENCGITCYGWATYVPWYDHPDYRDWEPDEGEDDQ